MKMRDLDLDDKKFYSSLELFNEKGTKSILVNAIKLYSMSFKEERNPDRDYNLFFSSVVYNKLMNRANQLEMDVSLFPKNLETFSKDILPKKKEFKLSSQINLGIISKN